MPWFGRAVAQAVSRWLPTAAARVRVRTACGVCGGQGGTWAGFLRVLRFPLPIIPPNSRSS
jgi:ribosomal protein S14